MQRTDLIKHGRTALILPTEEWFPPVEKYTKVLDDVGMSMRTAVETTLTVTMRAVHGSMFRLSLPDSGEYNNMLVQHLMQIESEDNQAFGRTATNDFNIMVAVAEVSTHFYNQLTKLFRDYGLSEYQVKTMQIVGWEENDLVVSIVRN